MQAVNSIVASLDSVCANLASQIGKPEGKVSMITLRPNQGDALHVHRVPTWVHPQSCGPWYSS
jgi:hypothetical protein